VRRRREPAAIAAEVERLRSLRVDALRRHWRLVFGRAPPSGLSKDLLGRMVAARFGIPRAETDSPKSAFALSGVGNELRFFPQQYGEGMQPAVLSSMAVQERSRVNVPATPSWRAALCEI
jgi:hypothetical protein